MFEGKKHTHSTTRVLTDEQHNRAVAWATSATRLKFRGKPALSEDVDMYAYMIAATWMEALNFSADKAGPEANEIAGEVMKNIAEHSTRITATITQNGKVEDLKIERNWK